MSNDCRLIIPYENMGKVDSGAYQLITKLPRRTVISVGALGRISFSPGTYLYTGRASRNLALRLKRHLSNDKKLRWHIDYFLQHGEIVEAVIYLDQAESECAINMESARAKGSVIPAPGFGSSDCRCPAHLLRIENKVSEVLKKRALSSASIGVNL